MSLRFSVALALASTALAAPALARRAPVTITKSSVDNINATYTVRGSSQHCTNQLLQHPDGGTLCDVPTCTDRLSFYAQHGKIVTFTWDRDARTIKPTKTVDRLQSLPSVTLDLCAPNNIDYAMDTLEEIPDSAFRYRNLNHADLGYSPVRMSMTGFNLITLGKMSIAWDGTGTPKEKSAGCESYPDVETQTCATFRYKLKTKPQRLSGNVSGTWASDFFIDPKCKKPYETGCTPRRFTLPVDFSPTRATTVDASISEFESTSIVEPMVRGKCSCPLVSF
jgi:hypothetical protein